MNKEFRISERNKIKSDISDVEKYIVRHKATIDRLKSQDSCDYNKKQIEKLTNSIKDYENKLVELNQRFIDVGSGALDDELSKRFEDEHLIFQQKQEISEKKFFDKRNSKINDDIKLQKYYDDNRKNRTESQYSIAKETDKFIKNNDILPEYILEKLTDMPCNKGHIWRGIWAMGKKPAKGTDIVMFENLKGGVTRIIEIDKNYKTIYERVSEKVFEKNGRNRTIQKKTLISRTERVNT
jgi:hypothetical protein